MKNITLIFLNILLLTGCSTLLSNNNGILGHQSEKQSEAKENIQDINSKLADINIQRLSEIGDYNYGSKYALDKLSAKTNETAIVYDFTTRISALAEKPTLDAVKEMENMVNNLLTNKIKGEKELANKDEEISDLNKQIFRLQQDRKEAINKYVDIAEANAQKVDQYKATLNQLDSWGGLGAIFYGVKKLVIRLSWIIGISSILFLILRLAAASNPLAGTLFACFEHVASYFLKMLVSIFPKALSFAGYIEQSVLTPVMPANTNVSGSKG